MRAGGHTRYLFDKYAILSLEKNFFFMIKNQIRVHVQFFSRWWKSQEFVGIKCFKLWCYLSFFIFVPHLAANRWVPWLAAPMTVLYLTCLSIHLPKWLFFFICFHIAIFFETFFLAVCLRVVPGLKVSLDKFLYGADITSGLLGNPGSTTIRSMGYAVLSYVGMVGGLTVEKKAAIYQAIEISQSLPEPLPALEHLKLIHKLEGDYPLHAIREKLHQNLSISIEHENLKI